MWVTGMASNELYQYDLLAGKWNMFEDVQKYGTTPSARSYHSMVADGSSVYLFGGMDFPGCKKELSLCLKWTSHLSNFVRRIQLKLG